MMHIVAHPLLVGLFFSSYYLTQLQFMQKKSFCDVTMGFQIVFSIKVYCYYSKKRRKYPIDFPIFVNVTTELNC